MRQLVAGVNYKLAFLMDQTECVKTDSNLNECLRASINGNFRNSFKKICVAKLYQSFASITGEDQDKYELVDSECY